MPHDHVHLKLEASEALIAQCLADVLRGAGVVELDGRRVIPMAAVTVESHIPHQSSVDGYELLRQASAVMVQVKSQHIGDYAEALVLLSDAMEAGMSGRFMAIALRHMGDIHLQCGDVSLAIECFEKALAIDKNAGCKRILQALLREYRQ